MKKVIIVTGILMLFVQIPGIAYVSQIQSTVGNYKSVGKTVDEPFSALRFVDKEGIQEIKLENADTIFRTTKTKIITKGDMKVTLPKGLLITKKDKENDSEMKSIEDFVVEKESSIYSVGDKKSHLEFSEPIKLELRTTKKNGSMVKMSVKHEGDEEFNARGLTTNPDATCENGVSNEEKPYAIVKNQKITIYTCGASEFKVDTGFSSTSLFNNLVNAIYEQPDGKIIVGGKFSQYNGIAVGRITRLNVDGTLDTGFNVGGVGMVNTSFSIRSIDMQADGKILVGGQFRDYNGSSVGPIIRLNLNGSIDTSFSSTARNSSDQVRAMKVLTGGKIVVGGSFQTSSYYSGHIALLNSNGSKDISFAIGTGFDQSVEAIEIQGNKILAGGQFSKYRGQNQGYFARLNMDGTLDTGFNIGGGFNNTVKAIKLQPDGKIVVGGFFSSFSGTAVNKVVRLNIDGTLDTGFTTTVSFYTYNIGLQSDGKILASYYQFPNYGFLRLNTDGSNDSTFVGGSTSFGTSPISSPIIETTGSKILVGGSYVSYSGNEEGYFMRLNNNGTRDTGFALPGGLNGTINSFVDLGSGKLLIGGGFNSYNWSPQNRLVSLNSNGTKDLGFNIGSGFNGSYIQTIAKQQDGKYVVGGWFTNYNGITQNYITRINSDGSRDVGFNVGGSGFYSSSSGPKGIKLQPDGKILVWGSIFSYNGDNILGFIRLNSDGSRDAGFGTGLIGASFYGITLQPDGKILAWGNFSFTYDGVTVLRLVRANPDGSRDTGFNVGGGFNNDVNSTLSQADGKILAWGGFTSYSGQSVNRLVRLHSDGILDTGFNIGGGFNDYVMTLLQQPDGKYLVGGRFTSYSGQSMNSLVRLNVDGVLDTGFNIGGGFNINQHGTSVRGMYYQPDGKVVVWGAFTGFNGQVANRIVRLNKNGSRDTSFVNGLGFDNDVYNIFFFDNKPFVYGAFGSYNGIPTRGFTRLYTTLGTPIIQSPVSGSSVGFDGNVVFVGTGEENQEIRIKIGGTTYTGGISTTGVWSVSVTGLSAGGYVATGNVYDGLGNISASREVSFVVPSPVAGVDVTVLPVSQGVIQGGTGLFSISITNTGNIGLTGLVVMNDIATSCNRTIGYMGVGANTGYVCTMNNIQTGYINTIITQGSGWANGGIVTGQSVIQITQSQVNISPVNIDVRVGMTPTGQSLRYGGVATFGVTVTNSGDSELGGVNVTNSVVSVCNMSIGTLFVGQSINYICNEAVTTGYTNTISVTGYVVTGGNSYPNLQGLGQASVSVTYTAPLVGDGLIEGSEQCDDNNTANGDGCNSNGQIEIPTCVMTGGSSYLSVVLTGVAGNGGMFRKVNRGIGGYTGVVSSNYLNVQNTYSQGGTYSIQAEVESVYSNMMTGLCMVVVTAQAIPSQGFGGSNNITPTSQSIAQQAQTIKDTLDNGKAIIPDIKVVSAALLQPIVLTQQATVGTQGKETQITIKTEDISIETRKMSNSQDISVQVVVNVGGGNMVILPETRGLTEPTTLVNTARVLAGTINVGEIAVLPIQINKELDTEKKCYIPNTYAAITLGEKTTSKDLLVYQSLLQSYGLTKFTNTDSYKGDNGLKRYEAAKMFVNFAKNVLCREKTKIYSEGMYSDIEGVDVTLVPYIKEAYEYGILNGTKGKFNPLENISKKEFIVAMMRIFTNENMDIQGVGNNWDMRYQAVYKGLGLEEDTGLKTNIERYDAAKVFYKLYYNPNYSRTEQGYILPYQK